MTAVVLPIRAFEGGKTRLSSHLSPAERAAMVRSMAEGVVKAAGDRPVLVVTSAPEVVAWAEALGLDTLPDPGTLDGAATAGREVAPGRVIVAHADLPDLTDLDPFDVDDGVVIGRSQHGGTSVLSVPAGVEFEFQYGPGSFHRHVTEAERHGLAVTVLDVPDVDTPDDL